MDHLYRRNQILEILRAGNVATQADLKRKLSKRGIRVTQATLSRDLEELGVAKTHEGYRLPDSVVATAPPQPTLTVILKEFVREVRLASNLVLVKTHPGNAHSVAVSLDSEQWPEVTGNHRRGRHDSYRHARVARGGAHSQEDFGTAGRMKSQRVWPQVSDFL